MPLGLASGELRLHSLKRVNLVSIRELIFNDSHSCGKGEGSYMSLSTGLRGGLGNHTLHLDKEVIVNCIEQGGYASSSCNG